jgi:hypothetical protein
LIHTISVNLSFYSLSIDNFFKNPDFVRKWALSLDFKSDINGRWPGERSQLIGDIDLNLNNLIISKIFSCYVNFKYETLNDCAEFIQNRLGYTVDTSVKHRQYSYKLSNVDFTDKELLDLLKNYYKEDYTELNY